MAFGMILIEGLEPNIKDLDWDSSDLYGHSIPLQDPHDQDTVWWAIITERDVSKEQYEKILKWCERNLKYQCGLRYGSQSFGIEDEYIIGYFRHPDDAVMFKMVWT